MKKMKKSIIALGMLLSVIFVLGISTKVSAFATTVTLNPNTVTYDTLTENGQVKLYDFTVDTSGYQTLRFDIDQNNLDLINSGWKVTIYDSKWNPIYGADITSAFTSNTFNFTKGSAIYVRVEQSGNEYHAPINANYSIELQTTNSNQWEQEDNNTKAAATKMTDSSVTYGNIYVSGDVDYYKYTVSKTGYFTLDFDIDENNTNLINSGWDVSIYDSKLNCFYSSSTQNALQSYTYNFKKGTVLYISVKQSGNEYHAPISATYTVKINAKSSTKWEVEKNDTMKYATSLNIGVGKTGNLYTANDIDFYKVKLKKTGKYSISFQAGSSTYDVKSGWLVNVYDANKNLLYSGNTSTYLSIKKNSEDKTLSGKKNQIIYIEVNRYSNEYWAPENVPYKVTVKQ